MPNVIERRKNKNNSNKKTKTKISVEKRTITNVVILSQEKKKHL